MEDLINAFKELGVTLPNPLDETELLAAYLQDSLEFFELLAVLGLPNDVQAETFGDLLKCMK